MTVLKKSFSGHALATTITSPIVSTDMSINVAPTTRFPATSVGPFVVTLDRTTSTGTIEKVLIESYVSLILTVASGGRGWDGTTAQSHGNGASCEHTIDATTLQNHENFWAANGTVVPTVSAVGDSAAEGTNAASAAADHTHGRESFGSSVSSSAPGDTGTAG